MGKINISYNGHFYNFAKITKGLVKFLKEQKYFNNVLIASNNSKLSKYIVSKFQTSFLNYGYNVLNAGFTSLPNVEFLINKNSLCGIYIYQIGEIVHLKLLSKNKTNEKDFETILKNITNISTAKNLGDINFIDPYVDYISYLNRNIKNKDSQIIIAKNKNLDEIFKKILKNCVFSYENANNFDIYLNKLKFLCQKNKKIGFAFNSIGTKIWAVDEHGNIYYEDELIKILHEHYGDYKNFNDAILTMINLLNLINTTNKSFVSLMNTNKK